MIHIYTAVSAVNRNDKEVIYKTCAQLLTFIRERSNIQINNIKDLDIVMQMYNLTETQRIMHN